MNFVTSYRSILKLLKKGCESQPHFINDVRVILSLGMVGRKDPVNFPPSYSSFHSPSGKDCVQVDTEALWKRCKTDLRDAVERDVAHFSGKRLPLIAAQILYKKELNWISQRLQKILSSATSEALRELRNISAGPNEADFIPDSFFSHPSQSPPVEGEIASSTINENGSSTNMLYSAGAIGPHRELIVYCRRERDFPLMHAFVGPVAVGSEEFGERYTQAKCILRLIQSVQYSLKSSLESENDHAKVKVEVLPFDDGYKNKSEAGVGQFSTAHRQFYVHISLTGLKEKMVEIVNVHFFRLEMSSQDLIEDIGYIDFAQVCVNVRDRLLELGLESPLITQKGSEKKLAADDVPMGSQLTFKVAFKSLTDGPTVVKGVLYYRCGESADVLKERSLEAIPFGPIVYHC